MPPMIITLGMVQLKAIIELTFAIHLVSFWTSNTCNLILLNCYNNTCSLRHESLCLTVLAIVEQFLKVLSQQSLNSSCNFSKLYLVLSKRSKVLAYRYKIIARTTYVLTRIQWHTSSQQRKLHVFVASFQVITWYALSRSFMHARIWYAIFLQLRLRWSHFLQLCVMLVLKTVFD